MSAMITPATITTSFGIRLLLLLILLPLLLLNCYRFAQPEALEPALVQTEGC